MKRFLFLLVTLFQITSAFTQNLTVQAPKVVAVGEQFSIIFSASVQYEKFTPPDLSAFNIMAGPVRSSSIINNNGNVSSSFTINYYVTAKAEGKITINSAEIVINGKTITSQPYTIEVVKADPALNQQSNNQNKPQQLTQTENATVVNAKDLYARVEINRSSLYRGESLVATLKIYTRVGISGASNIKLPTFTGFYSQEIEVPANEASFHRENINGAIYNVAILKRYILTPQQLGQLIIPPLEMTLAVQVVKKRQTHSLFDDFFDSPYQEVEKKIVSPSVAVNVKNLPSGAPSSFKGAVGNFKIESTIDKTQTQANQALAYSFSISGTGNLKLLEQPKINFPPDFDRYDPKISENIKITTAGNVGGKKYEYALIPRSAGNFTIPPIEFTYFDPVKGSYITLNSNEVNITVDKDPNAGKGTTMTVPGVNQKNIRYLGQDIIFIKTTPLIVSSKGSIFFSSPMYYIILLILTVIFIILYLFFKKKIKDSRNVSLMRNKTANKIAHKRLKLSSKLLKERNINGFYEELLRAMWGYVSDKLDIPVANLSRYNAQETLQIRNIQQADIDVFLNVIDECEFARYAPGTGRTEMEHIFNNAISIISKFEQTMR